MEAYVLSPPRSYGETGVDILAKKKDEVLYIEVIGYKARGPTRAKDFFEGFFRTISRIKDGAKKCVLAMPAQGERGLPQRADQYGEAWTRIGDAFPELEIWLVDTQKKNYRRTSWKDWSP